MLAEIGLRLTAGWTTLEIADQLNRTRPAFCYVIPSKTYSVAWVNYRLRDLRDDMRSTVET